MGEIGARYKVDQARIDEAVAEDLAAEPPPEPSYASMTDWLGNVITVGDFVVWPRLQQHTKVMEMACGTVTEIRESFVTIAVVASSRQLEEEWGDQVRLRVTANLTRIPVPLAEVREDEDGREEAWDEPADD